MKVDVRDNCANDVHSVERYEFFKNATRENKFGHNVQAYSMVAIPTTLISDLRNTLKDRCEDYNANDFDEDGRAKSLDSDDAIDTLLSVLFSAWREPSVYTVTIEMHVEAESEDEARQEAENLIEHHADYEVTNVEEED